MPLSDAACKAAKSGPKAYKLSDGGGLQLVVMPSGSKLWRLAYRYREKQKSFSMGAYPAVTLAQARLGRDRAKALLMSGKDPVQDRIDVREAANAPGTTFKAIAQEYVDKQRREKLAPITLSKLQWLLSYAYPKLGNRQITDIQAADIWAVLSPIDASGRGESARRLRSNIGRVFRFAAATGRANSDPTALLKGALAKRVVKHYAAITDPKGLGELLRRIYAYGGQPTTVAALKLMALLFVRPGELRLARWAEFDLHSRIWTIPPERMKKRREHVVPLSEQAIEILTQLRQLPSHCDLVFPSASNLRRPLSENAMNTALRRLGYDGTKAVSHGFRSSASTLLHESEAWHTDAIETQLSHLCKDQVRGIYARREL